MSGRRSKDKGKRGEREAAKLIAETFGVDAARGVQYQGGTDSPDVVHGLHGVHFEVKRTEKLNIYDAVDQAIADAGEGVVPAVMHRRNGKPWLLVLPFASSPDFAVKVYLNLMNKG